MPSEPLSAILAPSRPCRQRIQRASGIVASALVAIAWSAIGAVSSLPTLGPARAAIGGENGAEAGSEKAGEVELARRARGVLERYCAQCHSRISDEAGFGDFTDLKRLLDLELVRPKRPGESKLLAALTSTVKPMPPKNDPRVKESPDAAAIDAIRKWIEAGAPTVTFGDAAEPARPFISSAAVVDAIHAHQTTLPFDDRRFQRYFTLHHLHNQPVSKVPTERLRAVRAAVAKVLNSLSWRPEIVVPRPIDANQAILAFDLRDLDWDSQAETGRPDMWIVITSKYPYGLTHDEFPDDSAQRAKAKAIYKQTTSRLPWIRADWFVATASQPPLYHSVLYDYVLPGVSQRPLVERDLHGGGKNREPTMTATDLESRLRVDVEANIRRGAASFVGFKTSRVSAQERLSAWHPALYGSYRKSADFLPNNPTRDPIRHPLPPETEIDEQFKSFVHRPDGGEIIWSLPNGLQAYLLVDAQGRRINTGPTEVVRDLDERVGTPFIVNGLSCMACHASGPQRLADKNDVRLGLDGLPVAVRDKVRRLFAPPEVMKRKQDDDERRFLAAIEQAVGEFLRNGPDDARQTKDFLEPVGPIAKSFIKDDVGLEELSAELGLTGVEPLKLAIQNNPLLKTKGLAALANGAKLKRIQLEEGSPSLFQQLASQLDLGDPIRPSFVARPQP